MTSEAEQLNDEREERALRIVSSENLSGDIRDRPRLGHSDVVELNFIREGKFLFRRHHRTGLRSHIMEVLRPGDVAAEKEGMIRDGLRWFPRAVPVKMLRIFRTRFSTLRDAEIELTRVKVVGRYLGPEYMARSDEFLVDYEVDGGYEPLLCGLQEYVDGEILDPWGPLDSEYLTTLFRRIGPGGGREEARMWKQNVRKRAEKALERIGRMIREAGLVPDLAGVGNLLMTPGGNMKLVDINNISRVSLENRIPLDDRRYPACDKSIQAFSLLEQKLLQRPVDMGDPVFSTFLDPERMREVQSIEIEFHRSMAPTNSYFQGAH
ncbi:MAG: hypothetical protein JRJ09_01410 [Deltaproteobacteria bacterium]|nr:hypothetical protein [Deltaproteobacteria bacterium]MBW2047174.1 hypothetical protein [Deltaproteobacteria bacterium]MBW2109851.1 hypothetical protein [Deltaproteobacteria bacterium]MBW2352561.1 hypothetical protein [Deltaproteobacteria bacterium]HDZ91788.1 hypothetical protein [Deltaproteobacteria bacterium]